MPRRKQHRNVARARHLRQSMSLPEVLLWNHLRCSPGGVHFRRQHPFGGYVLDFYCPKAKLCIEVDGISHDMGSRPVLDEARDLWLQGNGVEVMRIPASEVLQSPEDVAEGLMLYCRR